MLRSRSDGGAKPCGSEAGLIDHGPVPIARTLGNCLSMSNVSRLVSLIGPARTKDLIFKARLVARPAQRSGAGCRDAAKARAGNRGAGGQPRPDHARGDKRGGAAASADAEPRAGLRAYISQDFREGMDAFLNKRTPNWKGK